MLSEADVHPGETCWIGRATRGQITDMSIQPKFFGPQPLARAAVRLERRPGFRVVVSTDRNQQDENTAQAQAVKAKAKLPGLY